MTEDRPPQSKIPLRQKIILILFGLFLFFVFLETGLQVGAFTLASLQEYRNMHAIRQKGAFRIMCLGESTAIVNGSNAYPYQLEYILNKMNIGIQFSVINKGVGATNTSRILAEVEDNINKYKPDMVVAMIGINDSGSHMPFEETVPKKELSLIKSLRSYKLSRLLGLHIATKFKEIGIIRPKEGNTYKNVNITPESVKECLDLVESSQPVVEHPKDEEYFTKAIALNPNDDNAYVELGRIYRTKREFNQSEYFLKKAIALNPNNGNAYVELGFISNTQEEYFKAEGYFTNAIELNPKNDNAYVGLGFIYRARGEFHKAEEVFKKAIELNSDNDFARSELGAMYETLLKNYEGAEEAFKGMSPSREEKYVKLAWIYIVRGKLSEAEELIKRILELKSKTEFSDGLLAVLYRELGRYELAEEYYQKLNELRSKSYNTVTRNNYLKLKEILDKHGIQLVCVQYPMRSIEPLKRIFEEQGDYIFVDNEKIFKDALRHSSYKRYFIDLFAGDFGHCSEEGNRLLAENIANVIVKEYFKK